MEAPPINSDDDPRLGEQDIRLFKGLDVFISFQESAIIEISIKLEWNGRKYRWDGLGSMFVVIVIVIDILGVCHRDNSSSL